MYTRYDTTRMSRDTIYTIVRDTTLRVDTSYMVNTSVRVDTSYTITANVRVDTAYTIVENVRVDTFYWAEGAPVWRTDSTEVTATYTLRFYKNGALNRAEMRQWRSDNEAEVTQYTGGYEFPYEGKTGVISIKFYSQDNPSLPTGIHFHGSVSGRNMILQNDQDSKVQRFVKQ